MVVVGLSWISTVRILTSSIVILVFNEYSILVYTLFVSVPLEMQILMREHFNRWYRLAPYYISILLVEIPFQVACAASYLAVSYWLTGQPVEAHRIIFFMVVSIAASLTAQAWGFFIGVTTPIKVNLFGILSSLSDTTVNPYAIQFQTWSYAIQ